MRRNSKRQEEFLVSWLGYPEEDNTWELGKDLKADGHGKVVTAFKKELKSKAKTAKVEKTPPPAPVVEDDVEEKLEAGPSSPVAPKSPAAIVAVDSAGSGSSAGSYAFSGRCCLVPSCCTSSSSSCTSTLINPTAISSPRANGRIS